MLVLVATVSVSHAQTGLVGLWTFDSPTSLTKADVGRDLVLHGSHQAVAGPEANNGAVHIGVGSYYILAHGLSPSGGGSRVNEFSLIIDVKVPQLGQWYCMYQANLANNDDGEWFINPNGAIGVGQTGYTPNIIQPNEWFRIGIAVKNGYRYDYYVDGQKRLTGNPGTVDGRFSLDTAMLLFADENQEDNELDVAEIRLYSRALSDSEMYALGGYHVPPPPEPAEPDTLIHPYLQAPTPTSIYVCWHAMIGTESRVEYGPNEDLGFRATGGAHVFEDGTTWHTVKLTDLQAETFYYYKAITDTMQSDIYRFKTPPEYGGNHGHIRFSVFGDTRTVPSQFSKVVAALKGKVVQMYSGTLEENLNVMLHVGDVVTHGYELKQYKREYFGPLAQVSANVPVMVSIGDHEHDAPYYYEYVLQASAYSGTYEILSSQFQVTQQKGNYSSPAINELRDFENIYWDTGAPDYLPIDRNAGIDLTQLTIDAGSGLELEKTYWWRMRYRDRNLQWSDWSEERSFNLTANTGVEKRTGPVIRSSQLYANYPNPFNPSTRIEFDLAQAVPVRLEVYSIDGKRTTRLINRRLEEGHHTMTWDGRDDQGRRMSSGTYFIRLVAGDFEQVRKVVLLK